MRRTILFVAVVALALLPAAPAGAGLSESSPLRGVIDMQYPGGPGGVCPLVPPVTVPFPSQCWYGTVEGDIDGTVAFWETDANFFPGKTEHYFEVFTILPEGGGSINGVDAGVWSFQTFKFRAQGWVTDASPEWASMVGYKYFEMGTTSDPNLGLPVTSYDIEMFLAKAKA